MTALQFNISLPDAVPGQGVAGRFAPLMMCVETLTRINQWHFRRGAAVPLEESGAVYKPEPPGREDWDDCVKVASRGWGDCEDLAAYLCAQIRELEGVHAECVFKYRFVSAAEMRAQGYPSKHIPRDGIFLIHVLVRLPNGEVLDPSQWLGMEGEY